MRTLVQIPCNTGRDGAAVCNKLYLYINLNAPFKLQFAREPQAFM
jgi:hypothetical protein